MTFQPDQDSDHHLPKTLPIFPLRNALLLPHGRLPLNIFEPRYLMMVDDALGLGRTIGLTRPRLDNDTGDLYNIGCLGRISSFMETDDGRYLITLTGMSRFQVLEEMETEKPYRLAKVDYTPFPADLWESTLEDDPTLREKLLQVLVHYLSEAGLKADWESIKDASVEMIVNSIAMSCPFGADEQQAILEAASIPLRAETLISLMEISVAENMMDTSDDEKKPTRLQ